MTPTTSIHALVAQLGGTDATISELPKFGVAEVRFRNSAGLTETRYGDSLRDLCQRLETHARRVGKKKANA